MADPDPQIPAPGGPEQARDARRVAARARARRLRQLEVGAVLAAGIVVALLLLNTRGHSRSTHRSAVASRGSVRRGSVRSGVSGPSGVGTTGSGGPIAPAAVGGLAALWAPQNLVGAQPTTAAAYAAASRLPGPAGDILIADRGNNRILVVTPQRQIVFRFPTRADREAGRRLYFNDDTFVEPGGRALIANEEDDHAIVEVGVVDHSLRVLFGHPHHRGSGRTHLNTPDDAYALPDGSFTVADAYNCRILFIRAGRIVKQYGRAGTCRHRPPRFLGAVNGDTPEPDGGVLISEIPGHWVDEIGPDGRLRLAVHAPVSYPSDPQPLPGGRILIADYANPGHVVIMGRRGRVLWRYGPSGGPGRLDHPSLAMALPNGNIAVNDDYRQRVVVIDPRRRRIVWQYGHTDRPGTAPGFLRIPDGMDFVPQSANGTPDYAAVAHP